MSVLIDALAYTLYRWLGVHGICLASQTVVRPCCFSTALILFPICTSLTFDIKSVELISCLNVRVTTPSQSNKSFHAVKRRIINLSLIVGNFIKGHVENLMFKDSYKRYLLICMVSLSGFILDGFCVLLFFSDYILYLLHKLMCRFSER